MSDPVSGDFQADLVARPVDGFGTNVDNPDWASTGADLLRLAASENGEDGEMSGTDRPNARAISNEVAQQIGDTVNTAGASDFLWIWGQFLDHDLSLTEGGSTVSANIEVPTGDTFFDPFFTGEVEIAFNRVDEHDGAYVNEITAFIDASMIYGSTTEMAAALRADGGKLVMTEDGQLELDGTTLLTGDVRAAENVALSSMHTIFTREHNRIVDRLVAEDPEMSEDALFDTARAHVEAIVQAITFNEFLPILVGEDQFGAYQGYDDAVNAGISVEFSTAVYRLGHTLLSSDLQLVSENGTTTNELALRDAFFTPDLLTEENLIEDLLRGSATQTSQAVDTMVVEDVRSFLFGPPGAGGFDLAALNIQRGRDLGVASYNNLRQSLGLDAAESFLDITSDVDLAARLEAAYGSVDLVDAWVGGLAEDPVDGALLGEMFSIVMIDQFTRLRDGDAFWSEERDGLSEETVAELWSTTLSDVIVRNTEVNVLQTDVFTAMDRMIGSGAADAMVGDDGADFISGGRGSDQLSGLGGDDEIRGGRGNDRIWGQDGDDIVTGGGGSDQLFGGTGRDTLNGDDGADLLAGGAGADQMSGGHGNDFYIVDDAGDAVVENVEYSAGGGIDTVQAFVDYVQPDRIEIVRLGNVDDTDNLNGTGNDAPGTMVGNAGDNVMFGRGGNDQLNGNDGDDRITGNTGCDTLVGGAGADTFIYTAISESRAGIAERDFINGFDRGEDLIDFSAMDANLFFSGDQAWEFIGQNQFDADGASSAGQLRLQDLGGPNAVLVEGDLRGDGTADFQIIINLTTEMSESDFIL